MKLFQTFCKVMPFLVGYDILKEYGFVAPNAFRKHLCSFTSLLGHVVLVSATILVGCFLIFEAKSFEEISVHFYELATVLTDTFYFISLHWMCKQFLEFNGHFEKTIEKRSINDEKREIYEKACKFVGISSNYFYIGYVKIAFPFSTVPYLFMSYFKYFTTDLGKDAFTLPFVMWTIFDWRTPTTYIFAFIIEFLATAYVVIVASTLMLHAFGSCWILMAFVDDIKIDMSALNEHETNQKSDAELYDYLCEFIRFHTEIKQMLGQFGSTYVLYFVLNLLWTASTMAVVLMSLQMEITRPEIDMPAILKNITLTFATILVFLVICSALEELKVQFEDLDVYVRCSWYRYPIKLQRILTIIIVNSQSLEPFKVFGSLTASRETCKKVIKGGFSTFMMLRSLVK